MIDVPELLRTARETAGLTQAELARRAGTSQPAVARYESGASSPSVTTLQRLLRACGHTTEVRVLRSVASDLDNDHARIIRRHRREIGEILRRRGFHSPRVFGSTVRGTTEPDSDIDLLVTPASKLDLMALAGAQGELEELLGVPVDLATEEILKPEILDQALSEAVPV
jgi:uncharacterized protein